MMADKAEIFGKLVASYRQENGEIVDMKMAEMLGRTSFRGKVIYDSGIGREGVGKIYANEGVRGWFEAVFKQVMILETLYMKRLTACKLLDVDEHSGDDFKGVLVLMEEVKGETVRSKTEPVGLETVTRMSERLFQQLGVVSSDKVLEQMNIAYCGDITPGNVIGSNERKYEIIEWDGQLGETDMPDMTAGYVAPELVTGDERRVSQVLADTYSLGCLLARILLGRDAYRSIVPVGDFSKFAKFEDVSLTIPEKVHDFFRVTLAMNPRQRVLGGVKDPAEHYRRLGMLFRGAM